MNTDDLYDLHKAVTYLLYTSDATVVGDPTDETLIAAAKETMRRREMNSIAGGVILGELAQRMSLRDIEKATDIPKSTVQSWAILPQRVSETQND